MIEALKDRMEDVYSVVLVANTPAYLYDNLRRFFPVWLTGFVCRS